MSYIAKNGRLYTSGASEALTLLDDKFSVNKSYSKGDSCIYNDYLWKFTSDKPAGEWDSSVVEQCRIMDFVDDINGRLTVESADLSSPFLTDNIKFKRVGNVVTVQYRGSIENLVAGEKRIGSLTSAYSRFIPSETVSITVAINDDNGGHPILVTISKKDRSIFYYNYGNAHTGKINFYFAFTYIVD